MMNWPGSSARSGLPLHVAGVGASAGGLEAMLPMFARMQPTGRLAFVVAQHMAKDGHDALVVRLMNRESALPVVLAGANEELRPDTVYVIPSGHDGVLRGSTLVLREPAGVSTPGVNALFESIAASSRANGIGIVLSGTGYDGIAGCRAIKAAGGLTVAQDPHEAKFDGMPGAAVEAGVIDEVLPAEAIADTLLRRIPGTVTVQSPPLSAPAAAEAAPPATVLKDLSALLQLVHQATGIDFSNYKEETLLRRLDKRMAALGISATTDYLALVRRQPEELGALQRLFLVSVSSFYRDRDSFRELERALAARLAGKRAAEPIRVWVPACASGEEPYTLAMMICELLGEYRRDHPVRIVGTDLNPEALDLARAGVYRLTACTEMDPAVRERHLESRGQHVAVRPWLREMVTFEERDVLTGPPAILDGPLDLVSCRNLLIYLKSPLQDRLIAIFHRALAPEGLLFIGNAESIGVAGNALFAPGDHYHRLFRRRT